MATVAISYCTAGNRSMEGGTMTVPRMTDVISERITVSGTSQATAASNPVGRRKTGFVSITAIDGNVWAVAGAAPVAVAGAAGFPVLSGQTRDFAIEAGDRVAVILL